MASDETLWQHPRNVPREELIRRVERVNAKLRALEDVRDTELVDAAVLAAKELERARNRVGALIEIFPPGESGRELLVDLLQAAAAPQMGWFGLPTDIGDQLRDTSTLSNFVILDWGTTTVQMNREELQQHLGMEPTRHHLELASRRGPGRRSRSDAYYLGQLRAWWNLLVVATAVGRAPDTQTTEERRQLPAVLDARTAGDIWRALEPFLGELQALLHDEQVPIGELDERYLQAQHEKIQIELRLDDGADWFAVQRAISNISKRLMRLGSLDDDVLQDLTSLGFNAPDAQELLDRWRSTAAHLARMGEPPEDETDPAIVDQAAEAALEGGAQSGAETSASDDLLRRAWEKFVLEGSGAAGKEIGNSLGKLPGRLTLLGAIAVGLGVLNPTRVWLLLQEVWPAIRDIVVLQLPI